MNTHLQHPLDTPWRRLLAGVLVLCMTLAAVPALAHCCADRCHDAEPVAAATDDCDCSLSGVEPPVDLLSVAPDKSPELICAAVPVFTHDDATAVHRASELDVAAPRGAPDRTVILLI